MKKVGKEVLFLGTGEGNPRNGEGTFLRLNDGTVMYAFTEYYGTEWKDHAIARISACYSKDEGETWSEPKIILVKDEKDENIMSPSLVRLQNGDIGMIYLRKEKMPDNGVICMPVFIYSTDEGETWSEWVNCGVPEGYYCVINHGVIVQQNGRIVVPMSYEGIRHDAFHNCTIDLTAQRNSDVRIAYSDDNGKTWSMVSHVFSTPFDDSIGFCEPGIYEHNDGELWIWFRSAYGFQYESRSWDGGKTWTNVAPNFCFSSPDAPMCVKRAGEYTIAAFNPTPLTCVSKTREVWGTGRRTPFVVAISKDDAQSFKSHGRAMANHQLDDFFSSCYLLEDDPNNSYCYPAIFGVNDGFLVAYYDSADTGVCLNAMKMKKVLYSEMDI